VSLKKYKATLYTLDNRITKLYNHDTHNTSLNYSNSYYSQQWMTIVKRPKKTQ